MEAKKKLQEKVKLLCKALNLEHLHTAIQLEVQDCRTAGMLSHDITQAINEAFDEAIREMP